ncbi:MAG: ATP-binding protein [Deltaproteobacteria bacterium]|nr:ATP-binding protein [Deltaproteobacteria bacterium]
MPGEKKLELHVPSVLGFEKVAMDFAASVAKMMHFPEERIENLKTAVAEACINAIEHGNKLDAATSVGVTLTIEPSKLSVDVQDQGSGIAQPPSPNIAEKIAGKDKTRGWGMFLIQSLMDEVKFESAPEGGGVVRMVIHLERD